MAETSDSDYIVEEYIRPTTTRVPLNNDESADILGNFKDTPKVKEKYGKFPEEIFAEDYDHDKELKLPAEEEPENLAKKKSRTTRRVVNRKKNGKLKKKIYRKATTSKDT